MKNTFRQTSYCTRSNVGGRGRVPQCARNKLLELHRKFDELENQGVFARPESLGITAEYLNPSFLVKKTSGGFRLVPRLLK